MNDFTVCRVCLADNIRVHSIANTELQEIYENLTKTKLFAQDDWPLTVCYVCHAQLRSCFKFVDLAKHSESLLLQLYHSSIKLSQDTIVLIDRLSLSYSITPIESISLLDESTVLGIKENVCNVKNETKKLKLEPLDNGEGYMTDVETDNMADIKRDLEGYGDNVESSDSEDNIPLTKFQVARQIVKHVKINGMDKPKRGYQKDIKIDAKEVLLTKEQQTDEVLARSKSLNYLNSPFKCHLCYKGFVNELTYSNHTQKHDERSGVHRCEVCLLRYDNPRLLRKHVSLAHARRYRCNKCEHVSRSTYQARDHDKWHEGFSFECQLCSKEFRKRTSYLTHIRKKHPTECVCELCGFSFVSEHGLLLHKTKTHKLDTQEATPQVPETERFCVNCSIQFACLDAYQRHLLSSVRHTTREEYSTQCNICQLNHLDHGSLMIHMKIHKSKLLPPPRAVNINSALVKLSCDVCGAMFVSRSRLAAHVTRKHFGVKRSKCVVCEVCGRQFSCNALLRYHLRRHRGERPFACVRCSKRFADASQLRIHARTHSGERPYACHTCAKRFAQKAALNRHYRVHTGAKPYACQLCSKSFSQSNSLKIHVQCVHLKMAPYRKRKRATKDDCQIENKDK